MICKTLVVIVGAPQKLCQHLKRDNRSLENGRRTLLFFKLNENETYNQEYLQGVYSSLSSYLQDLRENKSGRMLLPERFEGVLVYYFPKDKSNLVRDMFFPEFLCRTVDFDLNEIRWGMPKNRFSQIANLIVNDLVLKIKKDEKLLSTLKQELASNANTTPMLLPVKNFPTLGLSKILDELKKVEADRNLNTQIREIVKRLDRFFPKTKLQKRRVFISKKDILFSSPGKDRHGYPEHDGADHDRSCWIKGNFRFGATFDSRFHYDCTRRDISDKYFLECCESQNFQLPKSKRHVNVYANDYLR